MSSAQRELRVGAPSSTQLRTLLLLARQLESRAWDVRARELASAIAGRRCFGGLGLALVVRAYDSSSVRARRESRIDRRMFRRRVVDEGVYGRVVVLHTSACLFAQLESLGLSREIRVHVRSPLRTRGEGARGRVPGRRRRARRRVGRGGSRGEVAAREKRDSVAREQSVACRQVFTNQLKQIVEIVGTGIGRVNTTHWRQHDRAVQNAQLAALRREEEARVRERICAETWHDRRVDCITGNGVMSELSVGDDVFDHDSEEELHIVSAVSRGDVIGSDASDHR
ncbi:uncharacterized protein C8Q71DRAFT_875757 [Rhodofomes roseus]|uniref:Uncharacterized protein n=1 Tax=Rhodofomes roseus TaxID=34475 RepID=A0ABQ8K7J8_9APHY|nr:uncharacterized protein C8Q71DRAFT_875757 [Rhodofomes roseus]KAH9833231.1 hypothetical protein C8Q71DRAFT_875757 [Rhodofomes roseus]